MTRSEYEQLLEVRREICRALAYLDSAIRIAEAEFANEDAVNSSLDQEGDTHGARPV